MKAQEKLQVGTIMVSFAVSVLTHVYYPTAIVASAWGVYHNRPKTKLGYVLYGTAVVVTLAAASAKPIIGWGALYAVYRKASKDSERLEQEFAAFRNRKLVFLDNPHREKRLKRMNEQLERRIAIKNSQASDKHESNSTVREA